MSDAEIGEARNVEDAKPAGLGRRSFLLAGTAIAAGPALLSGIAQPAAAQESKTATGPAGRPARGKRPNILVIWGDDVGWQNVSAYGLGTMGYTTPNLDRIGKEGIVFTDQYAQNSCTAGRAAFITGQYPIRSGMVTVGVPGDPRGLQAASPCLAEVLKKEGYACGQFGKNHLGDRNEHLPTAHGFDEFFGILYHLNVYEQPDYPDYKRFAENYHGGPEAFAKKFGIRGVVHSYATEKDDPTEDERFGKVGKQTITDTGPLNQERMMDFDAAEVAPKAFDFMKKAKDDDKPFFVWLNTTRMHLYTRLNEKWRLAADKYTHDEDYHGDGMLQHDHDIGLILDWLKDNGLEEDTIVWYSTDNGPEHSSWPYGGTTPFRGEKMTCYEGGVRVPSMLRWPGTIEPNRVLNGIQSHMDMFTTLAAAAGVSDVVEAMKTDKKQYIDGVDNLDYWLGETDASKRSDFLYYYESTLMAVRMGPWKMHFITRENYYDGLRRRAGVLMFNIRSDPFESYDSVDAYGHLAQRVSWLFEPMSELVGDHLKTLAQFPPVQRGSSIDMSSVVEDFLERSKE
ncbi:MAG: arylsulfatase [Shinella sp.]|uniref:arylsulfatase n=1 Tax=Shinella sp. TaxID=1870904 RepID=UPI0040372F43